MTNNVIDFTSLSLASYLDAGGQILVRMSDGTYDRLPLALITAYVNGAVTTAEALLNGNISTAISNLVASTDPLGDRAFASGILSGAVTSLTSQINSKVSSSLLGAVSGVATLNSNGYLSQDVDAGNITTGTIDPARLSANLTAEAGLSATGSQISYYTAPGTKTLAPITPFALELLGASNSNAYTSILTLTPSSVGLGNVPNINATNPANIVTNSSYKFVSDAQVNQWNNAQPALPSGSSTQYLRGDLTMQTLNPVAVGLGNVTNVAQIPLSYMGSANGVATLDNGAHLTGTQFPGLTGDVLVSIGTLSASLAASGVNAGVYGDTTNSVTLTVDAKGRITTVQNAPLTNASVGLGNVTNDAQIPWSMKGVANGVAELGSDALLDSDDFPVLTGDVTTAGGSLSTTLAASGVTAGTYGASNQPVTITVDSKGRVISISQSNVTNSSSLSVNWSQLLSIPANITAEAGLVSTTDTLSYYTGAGTKSLTALTSFARTLLGESNAAAFKAQLALTSTDVGLENVVDNLQVLTSAVGQPDGIATLDSTSNVPLAQLGNVPAHTWSSISDIPSPVIDLAGLAMTNTNLLQIISGHVSEISLSGLSTALGIPTINTEITTLQGDFNGLGIGLANGIATLDGSSHVPATQLENVIDTIANYLSGPLTDIVTMTPVDLKLLQWQSGHLGQIAVADLATGLGVGAASGIATLDSGTHLTPAQMPALSGDISTTAGATVTTLATTGVAAGTYGDTTNSVTLTVDAKGRITSISNATITPASIGLGNVNNTSDLNKPISTATQTAITNVSNVTNLSKGFLDQMAGAAVVSGGLFILTGGTSFSIAAGSGYAKDSSGSLTLVTWGAITGSTINPADNYINIDYTGSLSITSSTVTDDHAIQVGYVYTDASNSNVLGWSAIKNIELTGFMTSLVSFYSNTVGVVVESGFELSEQASPNFLQLSVNSGTFWITFQRMSLTSDITTFTKLLDSADYGWFPDSYTTANEVTVGYYNDPTQPAVSCLIPMTTGYWKKDVVFLTPDGSLYYVYGQTQYDNEADALNGSIPNIPPSVNAGVVIVGSIVSTTTSTTVAAGIQDTRPVFSRLFEKGSNATLGSAISHSSLQDLSHDDHLQYLTTGRGDARYFTQSQSDLRYAASSQEYSFSEIIDTPTTLAGYGITDAQPLNSYLTQIAGLTPSASDYIQYNGSVFTNVTPSAVKTSLSLANGDVGLGNVTNDAQVKRSEMAANNGVATLDSSGNLVQNVSSATQTLIAGKINTSLIGAVNGVASLDSSGILVVSELPALSGDVTTTVGTVVTSLATVNANVGSFGDASHTASVTVNAKGLITAISANALTNASVGLGNVLNVAQIPATSAGAANGVATLDAGALIPAAQLPAYTGDVTSNVGTTVNTLATVNSNVGSFGDTTHAVSMTVNGKGLVTAISSVALTKSSVGLGNVDNTSDASKPISTATQTALNAKVDNSSVGAASGIAELDTSGYLTSAEFPILSGDVTTAGGLLATTLATVNSNVGSFGDSTHTLSMTVNAKGLVTAISANALTSASVGLGNVTNVLQVAASTLGAVSGTATLDGAAHLAAAQFPILTGDITTAGGALGTTLAVSGVTAGSYGGTTSTVSITVDAKGRVTSLATHALSPSSVGLGNVTNVAQLAASSAGAASGVATLDSGTYLTATQFPALTGDVAVSAGSTTTTLATVNANVGSFGDSTHTVSLTVNGKGLITAVSNNALTSASVGLGNVSNVAQLAASTLGAASGAAQLDGSSHLLASEFPALTGDITTAAGAVATTLATVNSNVGTFGSATQALTATVNAKGLVTAISAVTATLNTTTMATLLTMAASSYTGQTWFVTDAGVSGSKWYSNGTTWVCDSQSVQMSYAFADQGLIVFGGASATYSQTGTTVTVTKTAHGITNMFAGGQIYLTQSTGALLTGWFTNLIVTGANTFTCVSGVSQSTTGNLGTQTGTITTPVLNPAILLFNPNSGAPIPIYRKIICSAQVMGDPGVSTSKTFALPFLGGTQTLTTTAVWEQFNWESRLFNPNGSGVTGTGNYTNAPSGVNGITTTAVDTATAVTGNSQQFTASLATASTSGWAAFRINMVLVPN